MNIRFIFVISTFVLGSLLTGCASTGGSHKLLTAPISSSQLSKFPELLVIVSPKPSLNISQPDADHMGSLIIKAVKEDSKNRFKAINPTTPSPNTLQALVEIKRYDEGSAFARFMLAGLGQIHIDADVILTDYSTKENLAKYEVTKTFSWSGLYGGATNIKDVEVGFSKAVADSII